MTLIRENHSAWPYIQRLLEGCGHQEFRKKMAEKKPETLIRMNKLEAWIGKLVWEATADKSHRNHAEKACSSLAAQTMHSLQPTKWRRMRSLLLDTYTGGLEGCGQSSLLQQSLPQAWQFICKTLPYHGTWNAHLIASAQLVKDEWYINSIFFRMIMCRGNITLLEYDWQTDRIRKRLTGLAIAT